MAIPQPENKLPRPYQILELRDEGLINDTQLADMLDFINDELVIAGRTNGCPKCGTQGYHSNRVDDPDSPDDYTIQCTAVDEVDPDNACLGWGYTPIAMTVKTVPGVYTSAPYSEVALTIFKMLNDKKQLTKKKLEKWAEMRKINDADGKY
ncbi:hypothetical protein [Nostoc linckia]|nr:hypothetical protein [Nostoc linckia]PHJ63682.1 hypothetical protein VF03_30230 [Nostoc linckia z2]